MICATSTLGNLAKASAKAPPDELDHDSATRRMDAFGYSSIVKRNTDGMRVFSLLLRACVAMLRACLLG